MKKLILFCLLVSLINSSKAQQTSEVISTITNFKTYGYAQGVRLDSIDAEYGGYDFRSNQTLSFDYGQVAERKQFVITDNKGVPISFERRDYIFVSNFLYYNGWELVQTFTTTNSSPNLIFKKRVH